MTTDLVWRIRNGESTNIWKDKWISKTITNRIQSQRVSLSENVTVAELIDPNGPRWEDELIQTFFSAEEGLKIKFIPLSPINRADQLEWQGTPNGIFSVKSAYHLSRELIEKKIGQSSQPIEPLDSWKII